MKIVCTGLSPGRIATELMKHGVEFVSSDITHDRNFKSDIEKANPDVVIHTAAMTDVDKCEDNPMKALQVNVHGVNNLTSWFTGKVILLSTDHVFNGKKWFSHGYTERHNPNPINTYGHTKYSGEVVARSGVSDLRIIRTSKVYNDSDITATLYWLEQGFSQEFTGLIKRSFVYVPKFVEGILAVVERFNRLPAYLNVSGTEIYSYADFWRGVCCIYGLDETLIQERRTTLKNVAPRPFRAGLNVGLAKKHKIPLYGAFDGLE